MRVLWTVNILFPEAEMLLLKKTAGLAASGGWLIGAAEALATVEGMELHIACPARVPATTTLQGAHICYHLYAGLQRNGEPFYETSSQLDAVFREMLEEIRPDLIDIHGTEYAHSLSCLRAAGTIPTVVTIQGFVFSVAEHYRDGLGLREMMMHRPFHRGIRHEQASFRRRAEGEKALIRQARNFIGRTQWDRGQVLSLNPGARYFTCQETLREPFYEGRWRWKDCEKHSIFLSQGSYPLKGLHQVLKALPAVLKTYPDTKVYVGGLNILAGRHPGHYARILSALIRRHHLEDRLVFTGNLDAEAMKRRFMLANVFLCPSAIENSSNSLGEAQLLGVPCIAADRGGLPSLIPDASCGKLYPFEDTERLARLICENFAEGPAFDNAPMREMARRRHDGRTNCAVLSGIYQEILCHA